MIQRPGLPSELGSIKQDHISPIGGLVWDEAFSLHQCLCWSGGQFDDQARGSWSNQMLAPNFTGIMVSFYPLGSFAQLVAQESRSHSFCIPTAT